MAWVSAHEGVRDHPKTRALSRKLQCSRHEAIGILVTLWLWGLNNADREGNVMNATADDIADGIMYRGQSTGQTAQEAAEHLMDSLISSGWIDTAEDGHFILHDWDVWQDQWYKALDKRAKEAERKRKQRQSGDESGMSIGQDAGQSEGQGDGTSEHNRNRNRDRNRNLNPNQNRDPYRDDYSPPTPLKGEESGVQDKRFDEFWAIYPKKTGKQAAFKSWQRVKPTAELHSRIIAAVTAATKTEQWQRENGRYIPNPTTWLNQGRWDDEIAEVITEGQQRSNYRQDYKTAAGQIRKAGSAAPGFKLAGEPDDEYEQARPVRSGVHMAE